MHRGRLFWHWKLAGGARHLEKRNPLAQVQKKTGGDIPSCFMRTFPLRAFAIHRFQDTHRMLFVYLLHLLA